MNRFGMEVMVTAVLAVGVAAQTGQGVVSRTQVKATVTKINHQTRETTVKTADGREFTFVADPAVKNLDQVNVGDVIVATYAEALAYEVKKGGTADATQTVAGGTAEKGKMPAAAVANQVTVTVKITAIDPKVPTVTFTGPAGNSRTIKVRDPEKLKGVSVGDTVVLTYTEALAIKVDKAAK
jgi:hypothetical protein